MLPTARCCRLLIPLSTDRLVPVLAVSHRQQRLEYKRLRRSGCTSSQRPPIDFTYILIKYLHVSWNHTSYTEDAPSIHAYKYIWS
jgi:hypothetical protein